MITGSREKGLSTKQEDKAGDTKLTKGSSSSRSQWSALKDPRVVRVSRTFGGKDRHSKVCTIRGLRDRRVRLSVPTAIQLYDLQDRLGLNQPSKVVDWLLNVAKHEIDELPPLPISPRNFSQFPQSIMASHDHQVSGFQSSLASINDNIPGQDQVPRSTFWNLNAPSRSEEVVRENVGEKSSWIRPRNEQENQGGFEVYNPQISLQNPFPRATTTSATTNPSFSGLLNNMIPYNSYYHWESSNLSLSHGLSIQTEDPHNYNNLVPPSPQVLLCPSGTASFFSPYVTTQVADSNPRQMNHLQMLNSTSQNLMANSLTYPLSQPLVGPLQLGLTPNFLSSQNHNATQSNKGISSTSLFFPNDPKSFG